jgi:hypothetical protein
VRAQVDAPAAPHNPAGQIESFGFLLFATALPDRDPALQQAIMARLKTAPMLEDPAALLGGRTQLAARGAIAIEATPDPAQALRTAEQRLLAARSGCVAGVDALGLTAAGLVVIAQADARTRMKKLRRTCVTAAFGKALPVVCCSQRCVAAAEPPPARET